MIKGWRYYNYAVVPTSAPHEEVDITPIKNNTIWNDYKNLILARWTTDFDCQEETNWWYVIKDTPFDISHLKSKRRYEINKGIKNFIVREIVPSDYCEAIWKISVAAYETYPKSYRPQIIHDKYINTISKWKYYKTYGAFSVSDGALCGYACLLKEGKYIDFCMMKAFPEREKYGLNAAMVYTILHDHEDFLSGEGYICDGARSIQHETAFQDYLEKYFEFRKAYCRLHIVYAPRYKHIISMAYSCRRLIKKFNRFPIIGKINALLKMEEINRKAKGEI